MLRIEEMGRGVRAMKGRGARPTELIVQKRPSISIDQGRVLRLEQLHCFVEIWICKDNQKN